MAPSDRHKYDIEMSIYKSNINIVLIYQIIFYYPMEATI